MRGWFDSFRTDGGPTIYAYSNRTSVTGDVPTITILLVFLTIFAAFLLIFPGVRKERFSSFCTVTLSLLTGIVICICNFGSNWEVASGEIESSYRAFSSHKIQANLGVSIGLDHCNVTLKILPKDNRSLDIDFNERFHWRRPTEMKECLKKGLQKGLPFPIITAAEYLALDKEGFSWGRHYRTAGYYTGILLWSAFAAWMLANVLILNVPRYGAYMMVLTGSLMGGACLAFWLLKPQMPLKMRFEESLLTFRLGWCFWLVLVIGIIETASGLVMSIVDWIHPHKFSTIIEVDFDTPFDRHTIIEDSLNTRKRRFKIPKLEEPISAGLTAGSRLLRRLSKRGTTKEHSSVETNPGIDNPALEMDTPKVPWKNGILSRNDSKRSNKSVNFKGSKKAQNFLDIPDVPPEPELPKGLERSDSKQSTTSSGIINKNLHISEMTEAHSLPDIRGMLRQDSSQSCSSASSYGLGIFSRGSSVRKFSAEDNFHQPVSRTNSGNLIIFHRTDSRGQLQRLSGEVVEIQTDDSTDDW